MGKSLTCGFCDVTLIYAMPRFVRNQNLFVIVICIIVVIGTFVIHKNVQSIPQAHANAPSLEQIPIVPLSATCKNSPYDKDVEYNLTRAYRVKDIADEYTKNFEYMRNDAPEIGINDFLIIEGTATEEKPHYDIHHLEFLLRLVRPDSIHRPQHLDICSPKDATHCWANIIERHQTGPALAIFPVRPEERVFTLYFCSFVDPTRVTIDFSKAEVRTGAFTNMKGLQLQ